jgi:hypothetical protein
MGGFVPERSVFSDQLLLNGIKWLRPPFSIVEENLKHVLNGICQVPGDRNGGENKPDISTGIGFRETGFKSPGQGIILIGKRINLGFSGFFRRSALHHQKRPHDPKQDNIKAGDHINKKQKSALIHTKSKSQHKFVWHSTKNASYFFQRGKD